MRRGLSKVSSAFSSTWTRAGSRATFATAPRKTNASSDSDDDKKKSFQFKFLKQDVGGTIPADDEITGGIQKLQLLGLTKWKDVLFGPFGTLEKPVIVESEFESRIVGCVGPSTDPHDLLWHVVKEGPPTICLDCGQVFQFKRLDTYMNQHHH
eukprot:TRINITY_DN262_c0_g1_i1.p1 TRINITY_DN262_c0_g1~~TRINITY_DN262_c0_g1_i1.p1  ORF type:complete len:153 (+),score=22.21 TRINITY_DN262_c0_g1_i1:88-546(+)